MQEIIHTRIWQKIICISYENFFKEPLFVSPDTNRYGRCKRPCPHSVEQYIAALNVNKVGVWITHALKQGTWLSCRNAEHFNLAVR